MGPSSVRRDILNSYREEQSKLATSSRGRRARRPRRVPRGLSANDEPATPPSDSREDLHMGNGSSEKEKTAIEQEDHDVDDDGEFFDAEDAAL